MYPVSEKYLSTVRESGKRKTVVDLYYQTDAAPLLTDIPVVSGSLTCDRTSEVRRSGSIIVADRQLNINNFLPTGIEIRIRSGFEYATGGQELATLGIFPLEDVFFNEGANNTVTLEFFDRGQRLTDFHPLEDRDISGLTYDAAIRSYMDDVFVDTISNPGLIIDPSFDITQKLPGGASPPDSAIAAIGNIVKALAGEQYFDVNGDLVIGVIPKISDKTAADSVWSVDVGKTGVLIEAQRKTTRVNTFNGIAVYGPTAEDDPSTSFIDESITDTIHSILYDDEDPNSVTYYNGRFGRRTLRIQSDLITTQVAADKMAFEMLKNYHGLAKAIDFKALWNPALVPGDIVLFTFLDGSKELHLIDELEFDFASGVMSGKTRSVDLAEGVTL